MNFARRIGARRLGIASCIGLIREARVLRPGDPGGQWV